MQDADREALATIGLLAAFADGFRAPEEVDELKRIAVDFGGMDYDAVSRRVMAGGSDLDGVVAELSGDDARRRAFELALAVVHADGVATAEERDFLARLRTALALPASETAAIEAEAVRMGRAADSPADAPLIEVVTPDSTPAELDGMVLNAAMLAAALELLPQRLATLAIVPIQLRMVYLIGKDHGQELDTRQVKDLAATLGIGAAGQVMEGLARRFLGGVARGVFGRAAGRVAGGVAGAASGAALTFATTYALGQVARQYYGQGRRLSSGDLRALFGRLRDEARDLFPRVEGQIRKQAERVDVADLLRQVRG